MAGVGMGQIRRRWNGDREEQCGDGAGSGRKVGMGIKSVPVSLQITN